MIFFDFEVDTRTNHISEIGATSNKGYEIYTKDINKFVQYIQKNKPKFFVGHNIIAFDMKYVKDNMLNQYIIDDKIIDTLYLSTLFFPRKNSHSLIKDYKFNVNYMNDPLQDARHTKSLFYDCINEFQKLNNNFKDILYLLLNKVTGIKPLFLYLNYYPYSTNIVKLLNEEFAKRICFNKELFEYIEKYPLELSFVLSYVNTNDTHQSLLPPWVIKTFPKVEEILLSLRITPCHQSDCPYCNEQLSSLAALKKYFNYNDFKKFNDIPLQELAVNSALDGESLIAIFPTGGGKSITFQLPALMAGDMMGGLTVVISPLLALMKDQVDNLKRKHNINRAAFINSLLRNPIERKDVIQSIEDGKVSILYLSPEALRNRNIYRLLLKRQIVRFVIDEAHCFSSWGHDFRTDYLYIGEVIKQICKDKGLTKPIPVSCFTATARQKVIEDIKIYFNEKLNIDLKEFKTTQTRTNLEYKVIQVSANDTERYYELRNLLEGDNCPTIIYCAKTKTVDLLYNRLKEDGFKVSKFHGQMEEEEKIIHQNDFMSNNTHIMVATNAFGMGVDKNDIGVIIHYQITSSLEDYVQEAGRAGRNSNIHANCYILYNEEDLNIHFSLLHTSKVTQKEINQLWLGLKKELKAGEKISRTSFELAKSAGWDSNSDNTRRVGVCLSALEQGKFIKRLFNSPRIYADSLRVNNFAKAEAIIRKSPMIPEEDKEPTKRIIQHLISQYSTIRYKDKSINSQVDYLADILGLEKEKVIKCVNYLREVKILADSTDLVAKFNKDIRKYKSDLHRSKEILEFLLENFYSGKRLHNLKELNEICISKYEKELKYKSNINIIKLVVNLFDSFNVIKSKKNNDYIEIDIIQNYDETLNKFKEFFNICEFIIEYLNIKRQQLLKQVSSEISFVEISLVEVKEKYVSSLGMITKEVTIDDIEKAILILHYLDIIKFKGGFLVCHLPLTIKRLEKNNNRQYSLSDYENLKTHYNTKNKNIHIMGRFAEMMKEDKDEATEYINDYFNLDYQDFIDKYFPGEERKILDYRMTRSRYQKIFGKLSDEQKQIILDNKSKIIGVAAGPGSGKTTLLAHILAKIIFNEDIRLDQLLMLTFSRAAALEFKTRLKELIGNIANAVQITTFHSFAFDLLGRPGNLEEAENVIKNAVTLIRENEADHFKMSKMVLVIDEAQDISEDEYNLICELIKYNENIKVIAVGDDDQNIYEFRGSSSKYLHEFANNKKYELTINYRSKKNIVEYTNKFISEIPFRLKTQAMKSSTNKNGYVKIVTYNTDNIYIPLIHDVLNRPVGRTAIITRTNNQAGIISALLNDNNIPNRLIQENLEVRPYNIYELRVFYQIIENFVQTKIPYEIYVNALNEFKNKFAKSANYELYRKVLEKFLDLYEDMYLTDLKEYLSEISLSSFFDEEKLIVANLHKVKGMQFDNVYLLYDNNIQIKYEDIRAIYVGMTRAKNYLSIHTNNEIFKNIHIKDIEYKEEKNEYPIPNTLEIICTLKDVNLGSYDSLNFDLTQILPGTPIILHDDKFLLYKQHNKLHKVGTLSTSCTKQIQELKKENYQIVKSCVDNLIYWYDRENRKEVLVMTPRFKLRYNDNK